jgi:hypothetical protein
LPKEALTKITFACAYHFERREESNGHKRLRSFTSFRMTINFARAATFKGSMQIKDSLEKGGWRRGQGKEGGVLG